MYLNIYFVISLLIDILLALECCSIFSILFHLLFFQAIFYFSLVLYHSSQNFPLSSIVLLMLAFFSLIAPISSSCFIFSTSNFAFLSASISSILYLCFSSVISFSMSYSSLFILLILPQ